MAELEPFCGGFLCTDVDREGTMSGVNLEWFRDLRAATKMPIVAAGGVSSRQEIQMLEKIGMDHNNTRPRMIWLLAQGDDD